MTQQLGKILDSTMVNLRRESSERLESSPKHSATPDGFNIGNVLVASRFGARYVDPIDYAAHAEWLEKFNGIWRVLGTGFLIALIGKRGTGKTRLAAELVRNCGYFGRDIKYATNLSFFNSLRDGFNPHHDGDPFKEFVGAKLVIIDDAHRRGDTEWRNAMTEELIGQRYSRRLDTLLISNESPERFKEAIGLDIYSRITEAGGVMVCDWQSFRETGKAAI